MIKKVSLLTFILCLLLILLSPVAVQARGGLKILDSSIEIDFPAKLNFNLSAESDVNITDIRLRYKVEQMSFADVTSEVYINFTPATKVDARWSWDMRKVGGLPPGNAVVYWWLVTDAKGSRQETKPARAQFNDTRYSWRRLTEGKITLYWYQGDESFARELLGAAQQALARLAKDTGAQPDKPINIYIYASTQDLQAAMIFPQEWTGGAAFPRQNTIAIGIPPSQLFWGKRAMAHELTHLVIHQVTFNPYNDLPTWLDEGLAMYGEGALERPFSDLLVLAIAKDRLLSVRSLSSPFSAYAEESILAYAQSYSLVDFLIRTYGQSKMLELLHTFRKGSGYDEALSRVYGFDMDGLSRLWREYVSAITKVTK